MSKIEIGSKEPIFYLSLQIKDCNRSQQLKLLKMFEEKISYRFFEKTKVHSASFTLFIISELNFKIKNVSHFCLNSV